MNKDWKIKKLGELCEVITKGTTPTSIGHKFVLEGINFIKVESISLNGEFILEKFAYINEAGNVALKRSQLKTNDILFSTDEKLLSQVILNLLKNASEALLENKNNPRIIIKLSRIDSAVKIVITNNGPQIPPETKDQIFVPFYTTKENGSGIGLSLSKQIILQMGGDIILTTGKENLTSFSIILNSELLPIHN